MSPKYTFRCPFNSSFLTLLFSFVTLVSADYPISFGYKKFDKNSKYLWSQISLFGDALHVENGSFVELTRPWGKSFGKVVYNQGFKLRDASFKTYFVFSLSHESGDGLSFVVRNGFGFDYEFAVGFDTKMDPNHVGVYVGGIVESLRVKNVSSDVKMVLNSGERLQCWIDFEASSKRLEVRVSKWGERRHVSPLVAYPIDLSKMFKNEEVFVGLASSNANTTQVCKLYSWSFKLRQVPTWMHSNPLDPQGFEKEEEPVVKHKRSDCIVRVFTALVFGTGCGALGAFIALCAWSAFANRKPVAPEEYAVQPVMFDYDKVKVIVIDKSDCNKK